MAIEENDNTKDLTNDRLDNPKPNFENNYAEYQKEKSDFENSDINYNKAENESLEGDVYLESEEPISDLDRPIGDPTSLYYEDDLENDVNIYNDARETKYDTLDDDIEDITVPASIKFGDPASGFPGGGPYRVHEDRLPPTPETK